MSLQLVGVIVNNMLRMYVVAGLFVVLLKIEVGPSNGLILLPSGQRRKSTYEWLKPSEIIPGGSDKYVFASSV